METNEPTPVPESELPESPEQSGADQELTDSVTLSTANSVLEEGGSRSSNQIEDSEKTAPFGHGRDILKAIEVVERDSLVIAQSYTSLFASLRLALSKVTSTSVDHMDCFSDAAGRLQECALDGATKGNRYINSCLRLNEEMKGVEKLGSQLKLLRRNVDDLDSAVNKMVRFP